MSINFKKLRICFYFRGIAWLTRKDWYTLARWGVEGITPLETMYLVDFGMFTFGYSKIKKSKYAL